MALNKPQAAAAAAAASKAAQVIEVAEQSDLQRLLKRAVEAQRAYSTFTQEQVDAIFTAAAFAANDARLPLAKMAVAGAEAAPGVGLPCRRGGPAGRRGGLPACCLPDGRTVALGGLPCTLRDAHVLPSAAAPLTASLASLPSPRRDGHGCRRGQGEPPADWPPAR